MPRKPNERLSLYLLKLTGTGALFTVASILIPTLPYVTIKYLLKNKFRGNFKNIQIGNSVQYLKRKKFIAFERHQNKYRAVLTQLGRKHLKRTSIDLIKITAHPWDGKWRVVMFDIPEELKAARHVFRRKLQELGFIHFQRSVFLLPFKCGKEIQELVDNLAIERYVYVLTANRFPNDKLLLKKFNINAS